MISRQRCLWPLAALAVFLLPMPASASPWTMPKDELLFTLGYDFQFAEDEFLPDGTYQSFPLDGRFTSSTLRAGFRYGFTSKLEVAAELTAKAVQYTSDPAIVALPEDTVDLATAREAVLDFSASRLGPADLFLTGRYNFIKSTVAIANETRLKVPTGYTAPQGTFDEETGAIADDVALGDGQADLEDSILFGVFIPPTRTFARLDAGFRLRFGGPGHQLIGGAKIGQFIGDHFVLFAGGSGAYTVNDGKVIGQTIVATRDDLQADDIDAAEDLAPLDLRLDKDILAVEGGLLLIPVPGIEIQVAYSQIVLGSNVAAIRSVTVGTALRFKDVAGSSE